MTSWSATRSAQSCRCAVSRVSRQNAPGGLERDEHAIDRRRRGSIRGAVRGTFRSRLHDADDAIILFPDADVAPERRFDRKERPRHLRAEHADVISSAISGSVKKRPVATRWFRMSGYHGTVPTISPSTRRVMFQTYSRIMRPGTTMVTPGIVAWMRAGRSTSGRNRGRSCSGCWRPSVPPAA